VPVIIPQLAAGPVVDSASGLITGPGGRTLSGAEFGKSGWT